MKQATSYLFALAVSIALLSLPFLLIGWWIQSNFGPLAVAAVALGGIFALGIGLGWAMTHRSQRRTLDSVAEFMHDLSTVQRSQTGLWREELRAERDAFNARARIVGQDERRIDALAHQYAKYLDAPSGNKPPEPPEQPWLSDDQDASTFYVVD